MLTPLAAFTLAVGLGVIPSPAAKQVVLENRVFVVSDATAEKLRRLCNLGDRPSSPPIDEARIREMLKILDSDRDALTMASPKIVTVEDREAQVQIGKYVEIVTGVEVEKSAQPRISHKFEKVFLGYSFTCTPSLVEGGALKLSLVSELSTQPTETKRVPYTYFVSPGVEGGSAGYPVPVTQWLGVAKPDVLRVKLTATIPDGQSVLIPSGRHMGESRREQPIPLLSKIPSLGKLFVNVAKTQEAKEMFLLVTPRIVSE